MISIFLLLALSQCASDVNDGPQTYCGSKAYTGLVDLQAGMVSRGTFYSLPGGALFYGAGDDVGFEFDGNRSAAEPGAELTIKGLQDRDAGFMIHAYVANGRQTFANDIWGNVFNGQGGAYWALGNSGALNYTCAEGLYCVVGGRLPLNYWGHHPAVQLGNVYPMNAGFLVGAENPRSGTGNQTDKMWLITYLGGWETQANLHSYELPWCDGTDVNPESDNSDRYGPMPDGGHSWYIATDAGHAQDGDIMPWIVDVRKPCQCDHLLFDGGLTSSWRRLGTDIECKP